MKYCTSIATLTMGLLIAGHAFAQGENELPLVPLPSVFDFTRGGGWGVALGVGVEYETAYDGSDEYEFEIDPAGAIQWRTGNHLFFWEGMELGWRGRIADVWLVQAGVRYEDGLEPDDSEDGNLDGFEERDSHLVGFLEVRRAFGSDWRNWIGARAMGGESDFGWLGVLAAGHRFGDRLDGTGTEMLIFSTFGTDDFITKDFGVTTADSVASGLPETELGGGYRSTGLTLIDRRYLTRNIHLIAQAGAELYSSDIQDSPVARKDYEIEVGLSIVYQF
jgi:MipA family protein